MFALVIASDLIFFSYRTNLHAFIILKDRAVRLGNDQVKQPILV
jgi:hypothetical protein